MARTWDANRWSLEESDVLAKLEVLRAAADESARHVRGLYVTFLLFVFYVAVVIFSTTDEQLLKETGAHLPLLDVQLPLLGFFAFMPWLVLFFHTHLLNQFFLLSRKLFNLNRGLSALPADVQRIYRELPFPLTLSYRLVGTHHPRLIRWARGLAVLVTMVLIPIALLLAIQWKFLPYHSEAIALNHQVVLTLDLLLLAVFWPRMNSRSGDWRVRWPWSGRRQFLGETLHFVRPQRRYRRALIWGGLSGWAALLVLAWTLLVPPGGGIEHLIGYQPWLDGMHRNLVLRGRTLMREEPPPEILAAAHGDTDEERAAIWREYGQSLDLRRRDLRYADFSNSVLWNTDLEGANLLGADLSGANGQGANLSSTNLQDSRLDLAELQGANLMWADLQGASLFVAQLPGADLNSARLQGANLTVAQLKGASFDHASLQGASLQGADLRAANLLHAGLQGADLSGANLQGADIRGGDLRGAVFSNNNYREEVLRYMMFSEFPPEKRYRVTQIEVLRIHLSSRTADLAGADLRGAMVYRTLFGETEFLRADLRDLNLQPIDLESEGSTFEEMEGLEAMLNRGSAWSPDFGDFEGGGVEGAIERFWSVVFDPSMEPTEISPLQAFGAMYDQSGLFAEWESPPDEAAFEKARADYRAKLACTDKYIARRMQAYSADETALAEALKTRAASGDCPILADLLKNTP